MLQLNLPTYAYRLENRGGKLFIFDPIRKKFVQLTPEEWVRQHMLNHLMVNLGYPAARTRVESGLKYNELQKRSDILIYDQKLNPLVLVECKAPSVALGQNVVEQIAAYNKVCQSRLVIISNGIQTYAGLCSGANEPTQMLSTIPDYQQLKVM
ncbi:type I restriction enzyme HsdR N-terminal domain-containing protein [Roseivirga thermotolerans]|uniref:type I restriction enzyme HsdR N-terminal domain-containing protein n=1 Tax=Roseivirga thermotolerans TaxID=1758176 RepID=UPI00273ED9D5|nr:type I restriction enzyme HsdR N-terminal domain-containing protein [Roseivirga thermotolerans]